MPNQRQIEEAKVKLRGAYSAFNRGGIDTAVEFLDPLVEWIEPDEIPRWRNLSRRRSAKHYLAQSRAGAAQVISEPVRFIPVKSRIVVFVHARGLPKSSSIWQEIELVDVYTFQNGRAMEMRPFAKREDALRWVGIDNVPK